MYSSMNSRARDRVTASGESPTRVPYVPRSPSIDRKDVRPGRVAPQSGPISSLVRESSFRHASDEKKFAEDSSEDDDMTFRRHDGYRDSEFDDENIGPVSLEYDFLPYHHHSSKIPSRHPRHDPAIPKFADPYRSPRPLPGLTHRAKPGNRRTFNDRPPSPSRYFHFSEPRYPRMNQEDESETYHGYPSHPDRYGPVRERQQRERVSEVLPTKDDPYNIRQLKGIYGSGLLAGNRYADLRNTSSRLQPMAHGSLSHMSENELDMKLSHPYVPMESVDSDPWRRPAATNPFVDYHQPLYPYHVQRNVLKDRSRSVEVDSNTSSDENEEAWAGLDDIDSQEFPESSGFVGASCQMELRSSVQADEDILNPIDWIRKTSVTEKVIKANHFNRLIWPHNWRHSNFNTSPRVLIDVWNEFLNVNNLVTQFGLHTALPRIDNNICQSKRQGTLTEVVDACEAWLMQESRERTSIQPALTSSLPNDSWDTTCEQFQRMLKVRDYLTAVCKDAEYLNELYPTLDAITWFERARFIDLRRERVARSDVVELKAVKLSNLAEILKSLNFILQALLWGWGDQSTICIQPDQETAKKEQEDDLNPHSRGFKLESTRRRIFASKQYDNGEKRIQACLHTLDLGLTSLLDEVEVFAAILSQALAFQCDVLIADDISAKIVQYGLQEFPGLQFVPQRLKCMGNLIQNRSVWVLEQLALAAKYPYVAPPLLHGLAQLTESSYVRTTIVDLARIWGPIWKVPETQGQSPWIGYRLPGGYIATCENRGRTVTFEADEVPCHFSTVLDHSFGEGSSADLFSLSRPYLLIGHSLPCALVVRKSCQTTLETGLDGMALQSVRTLKPYKYRDSTAFHIAVGYAGTQASWTTQVKTNPGILMKKSLLDRWQLEPRFRNPRLLLLWYGVEVSICTRNARRCRLVDVIRSRSMIAYLFATYHPEVGSETYKTALFDTLIDDDPNAFIELYDNHPEWQEELGAVVAHCLQVLEGSGVNQKGELGLFVFVDRFHDPEQLAILSKNDHTWIPLLKDSFRSAAFAVVSHDCLEYPKAPGQTCRLQDHGRQELKSVLQTSYTSIRRSDVKKLFKSMEAKRSLSMADSSRFKIKSQSSRGIILGTWHGGPLRRLRIPWPPEERFRERGQDGENGITVFAVSQKRCRMVRLREVSEPSPAPDRIHSVNEGLNKDLGGATQRARSPWPRNSSSIRGTDSGSQKKSQSSTKDDAEHSHVGSHTNSGRAAPEDLITPEILRRNHVSSVNKGTQTDQPIQDPELAVAPSPSINGYFMSSVPSSYNINSRSTGHIHDAEGDNDRDSKRRSNGQSSKSHSDNRHSHGHRKRRSHGERGN